MTAPRRARIADQIQRSLAEVIRLELRDPRVGMVTLTGVEVSRDQSHAKVFFTILGPPSAAADAKEGLQRAAGFLRSSLAHGLAPAPYRSCISSTTNRSSAACASRG